MCLLVCTHIHRGTGKINVPDSKKKISEDLVLKTKCPPKTNSPAKGFIAFVR